MKPETLMIDEVKYVRLDSLEKTNGNIKIIVVDRGFVYVGICEEQENYILLRKANNIRKWGTTKGIGELVNGPTASTICDAVGTLRIPNRAVISIIDVEQEKWNNI